MYREVLHRNVDSLGKVGRAKKPERLPVVFSRAEVRAVLAHLDGQPWMMASPLYGAGLRLMECVRLRVKDVDFTYRQILVRDSKGQKDRVTMLPQAIAEPLRQHLEKVKVLHEEDLAEGFGEVYLPFALARKTRVPAASGVGSMSFLPAGAPLTRIAARNVGITLMRRRFRRR